MIPLGEGTKHPDNLQTDRANNKHYTKAQTSQLENCSATSLIGSLARKQSDSVQEIRARLCGNCAPTQLFQTISSTQLLHVRKYLCPDITQTVFYFIFPFSYSSKQRAKLLHCHYGKEECKKKRTEASEFSVFS